MRTKNGMMRYAIALVVALCGLTARGDVIGTSLYQNTSLVTGSSMKVTELDLGSSGLLTVQLTDMKFPDLLQTLSFTLTTATGVYEPTHTLNGSIATSNTWSIYVAAPTTLYAAVFAQPKSSIGAGMYNVQINFAAGASPVPLPAGIWLLISGLAGLVSIRPKQKLSQSSASMTGLA